MEAAKSKGKEKVISTNKRKHIACPEVQYLRERNVGVVIREDRDLNMIHLNRDTRTRDANSKGKEKEISPTEGKENAFPVGDNESTISKAALAQRNRRERERTAKIRPAYQSGQRLRRERNRALSCIQPRQPTYFPSLTPSRQANMEEGADISRVPDERQMVTHPSRRSISMPSTSVATQNDRSTHLNQLHEENLCSDDDVEDMPMDFEVDATAHVNSCRHFLGKMEIVCPSCKALHWMDEKLTKSSKKHPLFGTCCLEGKVVLPLLKTPPPPIQGLYDGNDNRSKSFRRYTRLYNIANAFTSLGAKLDDRLFSGRGPTSFTIHGELRHRTGSLMPLPGTISEI